MVADWAMALNGSEGSSVDNVGVSVMARDYPGSLPPSESISDRIPECRRSGEPVPPGVRV